MKTYLEARPDSVKMQAALGKICMATKDYDGAYTAFTICLDHNSGNIPAHYGLGEAAFQLGVEQNDLILLDRAEEEFQSTISLAKTSPEHEALRYSARQRLLLIKKFKDRIKLKRKHNTRK